MICKNDCNFPKEYLEQLSEQGLEGIPDMIRMLINQAIQIERENYLQAKPYERSENRQGMPMATNPKQSGHVRVK